MRKKNDYLKYLKIFIGCVMVAGLLLCSVCAEEILSADMDGSTINIRYTETGVGFGTFIYVFNTKVDKNTVIDEQFMDGNLIYAGVGSSGALSVTVPSDVYGVYTVMIGAKGIPAARDDRTVYVLYEEPGVKDDALAAITGAAGANDMVEKLKEYNNRAYILDLSDISNQQELIYELVRNLGKAATIDRVVKCVKAAAEINEIKSADRMRIAEILENNKESFELDDDIDGVTDKIAEAVANRLQGNESALELKDMVREEAALVVLNDAPTGRIIETILKYNDIFNADISSRLNDISQYELEKVLDNVVFSDVNEVAGIVNRTIDEIYKKQQDSASKSSSSRRGGGGGGGSSYGVPFTLEPFEVKEMNGDPDDERPSLSDLEGFEWAEEAIHYLYENFIMTGDGNGNFRPGDNLTREEFTKILITAFGGGKIEEVKIQFADVDEDAWYKPYVATACRLGITVGITEDTFGVGQYITRQDAAVMLQRAADAYYLNFEKKQTLVDFTDYDTVSDYARVAVDILARAQIINGFEDGSFRPYRNITRAEIAKIIYECIKQ